MKITTIIATAIILFTTAAFTSTATASRSSVKEKTFEIQNNGPETLYLRKIRKRGNFIPLPSGKGIKLHAKHVFMFEDYQGDYYYRGRSPQYKPCKRKTYMYYHSSFLGKTRTVKVGVYGRSCKSPKNAKFNALKWMEEYERREEPLPDGEIVQHRFPKDLLD